MEKGEQQKIMKRHSRKLSSKSDLVYSSRKKHCVMCPQVYVSVQKYKEHVESHHNQMPPFICVFCKEEFSDFDAICAHKSKHKSLDNPRLTKRYSCIVCNKIWSSLKMYQDHMDIHQEETPPYTCKVCKEELLSFDEILEHGKEHDGANKSNFYIKYNCIICPQTCASIEQYQSHFESHRDNSAPFICLFCYQEFPDFETIAAHKDEHKVLDTTSKCRQRCIICKALINTIKEYEEHLEDHRIHHGTYTCVFCKSEFGGFDEMYAHRFKHKGKVCPKAKQPNVIGPSSYSLTRDKYKYHCVICETVCSSAQRYQMHVESHRFQLTPFKCIFCKQVFADFDSICSHKNEHENIDMPYMCDMCGNRYRSKQALKEHHLTHTTDRPFKCKECGKAFKKSSNRYEHMRTHSTERKYLCEICSKSFRFTQALNKHIRLMHMPRQDIICSYFECNRTFRQEKSLEAHIKRDHLQELNFHCNLCGKKYVNKKMLSRHVMRSHRALPTKLTDFQLNI